MHQLSRVNARTQSTEPSSINPAKLVAKRILPDQGCQTLSQLMYFALLELAPAQFILLDLEAWKSCDNGRQADTACAIFCWRRRHAAMIAKSTSLSKFNVQHFLPMILFVNYNSCMCFQDIFCIISHKICVSLQLQRWINSTLRNNEKSTAVLLRECHPLFTSE